MAKRRKTDGDTGSARGEGHEHPNGRTSEDGHEHPNGRTGPIEGFAEDLGRLLGTAQAKAGLVSVRTSLSNSSRFGTPPPRS